MPHCHFQSTTPQESLQAPDFRAMIRFSLEESGYLPPTKNALRKYTLLPNYRVNKSSCTFVHMEKDMQVIIITIDLLNLCFTYLQL